MVSQPCLRYAFLLYCPFSVPLRRDSVAGMYALGVAGPQFESGICSVFSFYLVVFIHIGSDSTVVSF